MDFIEIAVAVGVAVYAMIGGAMINAAITAPKNCLAILNAIPANMSRWLLMIGIGLSIIFPILGLVGVMPQEYGATPSVVFSLAQIGMALVLRLCDILAKIALTAQERESRSRSPR